MRRFVAHPAKFLHKMPDSMSYALGALIEPLSVAYHAVVRAAPYLGQPVFIAGAGPIGLAMALCARAAGAHPICITDLEESRLSQARAMGFDKTLQIDLSWDRLQTASKVREVLGDGCIPSLAFECTGAESSINSALYVSIHLYLYLPKHRLSLQGTREWRYPPSGRLWKTRNISTSHVNGLQRSQHHHFFPIQELVACRHSTGR